MPAFEILKSEKNRDVLLVDGYLFWFDRATPRGRKYWKCIYCYRSHNGNVKERCISRVITTQNDPNALICKGHNHERDTVLVEHMKTFGSIRRLTSALRRSAMKDTLILNKDKNSSTIKTTTTTATTTTTSTTIINEPLDLSNKSSITVIEENKQQKNKKKVLNDVLTTLYKKIETEKMNSCNNNDDDRLNLEYPTTSYQLSSTNPSTITTTTVSTPSISTTTSTTINEDNPTLKQQYLINLISFQNLLHLAQKFQEFQQQSQQQTYKNLNY